MVSYVRLIYISRIVLHVQTYITHASLCPVQLTESNTMQYVSVLQTNPELVPEATLANVSCALLSVISHCHQPVTSVIAAYSE